MPQGGGRQCLPPRLGVNFCGGFFLNLILNLIVKEGFRYNLKIPQTQGDVVWLNDRRMFAGNEAILISCFGFRFLF